MKRFNSRAQARIDRETDWSASGTPSSISCALSFWSEGTSRHRQAEARAQWAELDRRIAAFDAEFVRWAKRTKRLVD